ncbi:GEVED domain-containing protein [Adhaeribacter soli]|uniref:T9SS type A sorting domain-containing protein n=1 Tax=Adhaeribacter soli TaxID=2607655 RepID=A0A5N1IJ59_9BACT|nr:GEVED domain-containing protein [Adhaeribacter soli]KAA9325705.1 T9SS type A sorting domain-containing protein [Adhaeribacter soli]
MRNSLHFLVSTVLLTLQFFSGYAQCPTGAINGSSVVSVGSSINLTGPDLPTGGTLTVVNGYRIHRFTSSGTFTVPAGFSGNVGMLVVAGGGGGGSNGGGGGGGGGVRSTNTQALVGGTTYTITVGGGGGPEANGGNSSFGTLMVATGGGRGASRDGGGAAYSGGSGGGGSGASGGNPTGASAGAGSAGQGNNGGNGTAADLGCSAAGGGGGGAGGTGSAASSATGGNGGIGKFDYITGVGVNYAAGGGGGRTCTNTTLGVGGSGIGGNGGGNPTLATNGVANTGSGGGGGGGIGLGGSGGSGVVIVKYIDYASGNWASSNTGIATVNAAGVVTGVGAGTATIYLTTTCGSFSSKVITVNSTNADLSNLTLSSGTLSPAFASTTTNYTALVTNATSITVTPTKAEANASLQIQVNGGGWAPINSGSASAAVVLNRVKTTVDLRVTAQDGSTTKIYSVTITRVNTLDNAGLGSTTGAAVYSLRKLSSNYSGSAIQVIRSSDNAVYDIGFTSGGQLDTAALKGFVGNSNGSIVVWYDQSGYGRDLFQLLAATQPRLVNGGVIHRLNKLPAIYFGTSNLATAKEVMFPGAVTMVGVAKGTSPTPGSFISKTGTAAGANTNYPSPFDFTNNGGDFYIGNAATTVGSATSLANANPRSDISSLVPASVYSFTSQFAAGSTTYSYRNGIQTGAFSVAAYSDNGNSLRMGNRNELTQQGNFYTPEMVMFNTVLSTSERNTLETNQKNTYISADANLSSLSVNKGTLSPVFASATTGYSVTIDKSMLPFTLTAAASHLYADVRLRVNGGTYAPLARNTPSAALPVTVGSNTIEVKVTAQDGSTIKTYTINLIVEQYCQAGISVNNPKISSNNVRYIDNVNFAGINNNSGTTGGGYQDFTSQTGQVTAGGTYTFTATKAPSSNCLIYVWIDYNQDDDFTDTGELIYSTVAIAGPYTSAITIPLTASVGTTRMRIRLVNDSYGGNYTPCGDSYFGQVEDYSLNILPPPAPVCATGMFPANGTDQECLATLSWQAATNAAGYKVYMGSSAQTLVLVSTQTGTTYTPPSLLSGSTYYWKVVPYNSAADAPGCNIYSFTKYTCYCSTGTTYADNHRITEVHFAGINNYSYFSGNGYQQFTSSDTGRVMAGTTVPFAAAGNGNGSYSRFLAWIDYNRDGDFDDAGEQIYANNTAGPYSASITIPVTASIGNTRMRLRLLHTAYSSNITPCGTNDVGDVEDYTINIRQLAAPRCAAGFSPSDGNELLCSRSLSWQSVLYAEGYKVYTGLSPASLALVSTQTTTTYTPTGLLYGHIYYWKVVPYNSGGEAAGCSTNSFTVQPLACATGISPVNNGSDNCGTSTLSWQPVSCATGYKLYLGTSPAALSLISNQAGTAYSPSGLTGTSTYYWKVVPYNSSGEAAGCSVNSFTKSICYCPAGTDYPDGQFISNLNFGGISNNSGTSGGGYQDFTAITGQVTAGGTYNFDVSGTGHLYSSLQAWIDYNGDGDFTDVGELVYSGNRAGPYSSNITIPLTASVGLTRMRVRLDHTTNGYNGTSCGNSWVGQVEDYTLNILPIPAPGCATGFSPADGTELICNGSLSWQSVLYADGYKVYLGLSQASLALVSTQTTTTYTPTGLVYGQTYYWKIVPYNSTGEATSCSTNSLTLQPLACVTGISPVNNGSDNCAASKLSWQAVNCASGYKIYLGTSPTALLLVSDQAGLDYWPSGLTGNAVYYWKVVPYNSSGEASGCSVNSFTKTACYCAAGSNSTSNQFVSSVNFGGISNNSGTSGSGYQDFTFIQGQIQAGSTETFAATATSHLYSELMVWIDYNRDGDFTDAGEMIYSLTGFGPYNSSITVPPTARAGLTRMRVRLTHTYYGYNGTSCGYSDYGQVEDYSINILPLPVPVCVSGTAPATNTIGYPANLSWQASPLAEGYKVYMGPSAAALTQVSNQTGLSYNLSGLTGGKTYYWKVVPYNLAGDNTNCSIYTFTTPRATTWTGAVSTNWFDSGNWTSAVPDSTALALIPASLTVYPVLFSGKAAAKSLTISGELHFTGGEMKVSDTLTLSNGGALTTGGQSILTLQKQFTQSGGTFTATGGTVSFVNPASFTLPALTYYNLTIYGGPNAVITTAGNAAANGNLTLSGSGATLHNDYVLAVKGNLEANIPQTGTGKIKLISGKLTGHLLSGSATINNLEVDDILGATMIGDLTLTGALTLSAGNLTATAGKTLSLNGTISEEMGRKYNGELVKTISIGSGMANSLFGNIGVGLDNADAGNWGAITVTRHTGTGSFISNPTAPNVQGINRYWKIEPQFRPTGKTINLTLSWLSDENNGLTFPNNLAQVWKSEDNGLTWIPVEGLKPVISNGNLRSVTVQTSSFSLWTVSDAMNPLPVKWLHFNGKANLEGNQLNWATASEKDSKAFVVERSPDGRRFEAIGEVAAAGQSNSVREYGFLDKNSSVLAEKAVYYRLKQMDFNGRYEYSSMVAIKREKTVEITVLPNPFRSSLQVKLPGTSMASFKFTTAEGKTLYLKDKKALSGIVQLDDLPVLAPGMYLLQVVSGQNVTTLRVMKQ